MQRMPPRHGTPHRQRGVTLIELMVALVLGLVVSGAALALFLTNQQTYVATENLDRLQEGSRTAFELMARDLREADGNPCSNEISITNQLQNSTTYAWWSDWGNGLQGYVDSVPFPDAGFGTANAGDRIDGTPAVEVWSAKPTGSVLTADMSSTGDDLAVTDTTGAIDTDDILVICDYSHGTIFQATSVGTNQIEHHAGGTPGNTDGNMPPGVYGINSIISKLHAERWYIGYSGRDDRDGNPINSLYRTRVTGPAAVQASDEIVTGVADMELWYHIKSAGAYVESPADWGNVDAIRITLTLAGRDKIGTDNNALQRTFTNVVTLRSRAE